jgi:hypothetical protein
VTRQAIDGLIATHTDPQAVLAGLTDDRWQLPSAPSPSAPSPPPAEPAPALTVEQAMEALAAPRSASDGRAVS